MQVLSAPQKRERGLRYGVIIQLVESGLPDAGYLSADPLASASTWVPHGDGFCGV